MHGLKCLTAKNESLGGGPYDRITYGADWVTVPGNGCYVAVTEGWYAAGRGDKMVILECDQKLPDRDQPPGVQLFRRVRIAGTPADLGVAARAQWYVHHQMRLPPDMTQAGYLDLRGYAHPLPKGLTQTGDLFGLNGYTHPLPEGLTRTGYLDLCDYAHPLPKGLTQTGNLHLYGYVHPLPKGLTKTGSIDGLGGYAHRLPKGLTQTGYLDLFAYAHPLPKRLTRTGSLHLHGYAHPLPKGLAQARNLYGLGGYAHPLPPGLTLTGYFYDEDGYAHPLPVALRRSKDQLEAS